MRCVQLLLAAALASAAWAQDEVSLLQQSVGSLSSQGEVVAYEVGENVQVKFEGEKRWVDCSIEARGSLPNSYTIHVPSMSDGLIEDKTFNDVPWNMLRRVYKGFDINIDQGPNSSAWASCMLLEQQGRDSYKVELLEMRPGMVLDNVPGALLREGAERTQKVARLHEMLKENEAKKDLWYIAEVKQHSSRLEDEAKKQQKEEEEQAKLGMKIYVWKEMAERARKEEEAEVERKRKTESGQAHRAHEFARVRKAKLETKMDVLEQSAESDPVAALMLKAQQVSKEVRDREEQMKKKMQEKAEEEKKMKELEKKLGDQRKREIEEHQAMLKRERQVLRMKAANGTAVEVSPLAKKMEEKAVTAMELDQKRHHALIVNELESMKQEEDKKYKEEEIRRKDSMKERREAGAQTHLRRARRVYEEDQSKNKQAGLSALLSAITDASGAGLEDPEVDAARVIVTQRLTASARETLQRAEKNGTLAEVERAIKSLPGKASEVERIWSSIQDPESKWHTPYFEERELADLREQLPQLRMREVKFEALRSAIKLAKVNKNLLKKAINAAEKGGLAGKEIEEARGRLQFRETKPDYTNPIREAIKDSDPDALAAAVARAEAWGQLDGGFMHHARHVLQKLREQGTLPSEDEKEQSQETEKPKLQALSSLAP